MALSRSNPLLNRITTVGESVLTSESVTVGGTAGKALVLFLVLLFGASFTWSAAMAGDYRTVMNGVIWGGLGGFALAIATGFRPHWARITAPLYAVLQGLAIGGISALAERAFPGLVYQAVGATFGVALVMFFAYRMGWLRATERFRAVVITATMGLMVFYFVGFIARMFFDTVVPGTMATTPLGLGIAVVGAVLASLFLIIDFDNIERMVGKAPKTYEWAGAFGLLVTLVWLYLEILRILRALRD